MTAMSWISVLGTVTSISGAVISIWQAKRSKSAANEAKRVKAQLVDHRKSSELTQLHIACKDAQHSMEKYGPGSLTSSLEGISQEKDAQDVQKFMLLIKENRALFGSRTPNKADEFYRKVIPILDEFAQSTQPSDLRKYGKKILMHLNNMTSIIKKLLDAKHETVH